MSCTAADAGQEWKDDSWVQLVRSAVREEIQKGLQGLSSALAQELGTSLRQGNFEILMPNLTTAEQKDQSQASIPPQFLAHGAPLEKTEGLTSLDFSRPGKSKSASLREARSRVGNLITVHDSTCDYWKRLSDKSREQNEFVFTSTNSLRVLTKRSREFFTKRPSHRFANIVLSSQFNVVSTVAIVLNAAWLGLVSDYDMKALVEPDYETPKWVHQVTFAFVFLFSAELLLKIICLGPYFLTGKGWRYNILDTILMVVSVPELFSDNAINLSFARMLRIFKVMKTFRLLKVVRFFRVLRQIMLTVLHTFSAMLWSLATVMLVIYLFSVFFLQTICTNLEGTDLSHPGREALQSFGNMKSTMIELFAIISGGSEWHPVMKTLSLVSGHLEWLMLIYVFVMMFAVLNIIIGVYCSKAAEVSNSDADICAAREEDRIVRFMKNMSNVFHRMDEAGVGQVNRQQMEFFFSTDDAYELLHSEGIDVQDIQQLFQLLLTFEGEDGDGETISLNSFMMGMMRLTGTARCTDLTVLINELLQFKIEMECTQQDLLGELQHQRACIVALSQVMQDGLSKQAASLSNSSLQNPGKTLCQSL